MVRAMVGDFARASIRMKRQCSVGEKSYAGAAAIGCFCRAARRALECAGNGRALLTPKVKGVPWQLGAVGNAKWTGVPLGAVLERVGLREKAVEVVLEGADSGDIAAEAGENCLRLFRRHVSGSVCIGVSLLVKANARDGRMSSIFWGYLDTGGGKDRKDPAPDEKR